MDETDHHVRDDLETRVLGHLEALARRPDRVSAVRIPRDVLKHGLNSDLVRIQVGQSLPSLASLNPSKDDRAVPRDACNRTATSHS